ncbi:site-2 protease family protein, partial [Candidatus Gottesmanbacteria bacterium CG11_big_fil_rev_8_21_14_0_20_37_11]
PASNLLFAVILSVILRFPLPGILGLFLYGLLPVIIQINVLLAIFNLIPIHPLDGFKVVAGLLPKKYYYEWMELEKYGMIFLLLLIFPFFGSSPVFRLITPVVNLILSILLPHGSGGVI